MNTTIIESDALFKLLISARIKSVTASLTKDNRHRIESCTAWSKYRTAVNAPVRVVALERRAA